MGVFDSAEIDRLVSDQSGPAAQLPAGPVEAFHASYDTTRQEDLSISERQNFLDKVRQRNSKIVELTGGILDRAGDIRPFAIDPGDPTLPDYTTVDRARLAHDRKIAELSSRYPDIKTDADILKEIPEDSKRIREKSARVLSNTTFLGKVGSFLGAMAAAMGDPLVLATIPLGASAAAGILKTALIEGGINMASEALIQPFVYRYKQSIGSPYSIGEALTNVAAAGVGGAVIGGGVRALAKGIEHLRARPRVAGIDDLLETFDKNVVEPTQIQSDARQVLGDFADVLRDTPFDSTPALDDIHLKAVAKALSDLDAGNPVDVQDFVSGIPAREDLAAEIRIKQLASAEAPVEFEGKTFSRAVKEGDNLRLKDHPDKVLTDATDILNVEEKPAFNAPQPQAQPFDPSRLKAAVELDSGEIIVGNQGRGGHVEIFNALSAEQQQHVTATGFFDPTDPNPANFYKGLTDAEHAYNARQGIAAAQVEQPTRKIKTANGLEDAPPQLHVDKQFQTWADMAEKDHQAVADEISAKAREILSQEDIRIAHPDGPRSAREVLAGLDEDVKAANILQKCLAGGAE